MPSCFVDCVRFILLEVLVPILYAKDQYLEMVNLLQNYRLEYSIFSYLCREKVLEIKSRINLSVPRMWGMFKINV